MVAKGPKPTHCTPGLQVVALPNESFEEFFVTVFAVGNESSSHLTERLEAFIGSHPELRIVRQDVFGQDMDSHATCLGPKPFAQRTRWPVTVIGQGNGGGCPVAGVQIHAVSGVEVMPIELENRVIGAFYEDSYAQYCELGGLYPRSPGKSRTHQAREVFELIEAGLDRVGMSFANVFRTWFYLDNILEWYDDFNAVRNQFFRERKVYEGLVPASTGVGGSNAIGAAVVADTVAIKLKTTAIKLGSVPSPLQCPAIDYGSSFSRAVELVFPRCHRLYVSGTASIGPDGRTAHIGNVDKQVALTMEVVEAILKTREMDWTHVTRAIGYFKNAEDAPAFDRYLTSRGLPQIPVIIAKNDICRPDLLFEIEVDAARIR